MIGKFKTLQGRLVVFLSLIIIPCYLFIYLSFDYSRNIVKEDLLKMAKFVSFQAAENQNSIIDSSRSFLAALARTPQVQDPDSDVCQRFIAELTPLYDHYMNIGVPNNRGILTCNGTPLAEPIDVSDRVYILDAINKKQFTSSGVQLDRASGALAINFASPVYNNKHQVVGVAVVVMSLDWWRTLMSKNRLPDNSIAYVLDGNNRPVASYPNNIEYHPPPLLDAAWRGQDGISRVYSEYQVNDANGNTQLTFLTGVTVDKSLASVNRHYIMIIITLTIMVVIVLILAQLFFINSISKPLTILSDLARRLSRNEKVHASRPTGMKEMDSLQDEFIEMAEHKKEAEEKIIQQTQTDSLTGLLNRDAVSQILSSALVEANDKKEKLGVVLLDLDNFKEINDARGHEFGDEVLKEIATRLVQHSLDAKCIGRMGGDEFVFLFEGDKVKLCQILMLSEELKNIVKQPYNIPSGDVILSASFGVAIYPDDGGNHRELISAADQAMYYAKRCGRDRVRRFNWDLKRALVDKIELIKGMRAAIKYKEFHLVYQPIVDQKGKVKKFEALIRWKHPVKGQIPPDQFIHFAEESGLIVEIGEWVIKEAKLALVQLQVIYGKDLQVSVNISPLQLLKRHGDLLGLLSDFKTHEDEPSTRGSFKNNLVVEVTENVLMNLDEHTRQILLDFKKNGIQIALDDFGTGYSSLAYLMNCDIDYVKIDKSFVQKLDDGSSSLYLCEAIITMAHKLGISVVAEGVETGKQAALLLDHGCDYLQGYYFSRPMSLEDAIKYE
jgi:diguanylate cyclase (GGDEF)-like protein